MVRVSLNLGQLVSESVALVKPTPRTHGAALRFQNLATQSRRYRYHSTVAKRPEASVLHHESTVQSLQRHARQGTSRSYSRSAGSRQAGEAALENVTIQSDGIGEDTLTTSSSAVSLGQPVRKIMRHVAHPVAIVTSVSGPKHLSVGATISSFNTVSLEPETVISIHLRLPSSTYDAIKESGGFNLHVLREGKHGAFLADLFTKGNSHAAFQLLRQNIDYVPGDTTSSTHTNFPKLIGNSSDPLKGPVLAILECQIKEELMVRVGDVAVIYANVTNIHDYYQPSAPSPGNRSLVYVDGSYSYANKHHEGSSVRMTDLREMTDAVQATHDRVQAVVTELLSIVAKEDATQTKAVLSEKLGRLRWSLKSFEIFNNEVMKPFFESQSKVEASSIDESKFDPQGRSTSRSSAQIPSGTRLFSTSRSTKQETLKKFWPADVQDAGRFDNSQLLRAQEQAQTSPDSLK